MRAIYLWALLCFCQPLQATAPAPKPVFDPIAAIDKEMADLKQARIYARLDADIAGREADRFAATGDWTHYREAMQRQAHNYRKIRAYDARILALEKQKIVLQMKKSS